MPRVSSHNSEKHTCREGCDASFGRRTDRDRHEKIHRPYDEREFACSYEGCGFRANQNNGLKSHILSVHMKVRISCPFPGCEQEYSDPSSVTRHKKKCHSGSCPPSRPQRIAELSGTSSSSSLSSSRHTTMMNSRSEVPRRSSGCCACHVKLESATSDYLGHSVLHTKSSVMKPDFPSLCFPNAALQSFAPTSDLENQLLDSVPDFNMHHYIPTVSPLDQSANHFVSNGGMDPPATSMAHDLLLCKSVFDSNPSMSQYATNYDTIPYSMSNASHLPTVMGSIVPPRAINAASFAAPFHDNPPLPNYDVNFNPSQMQTHCEINIPPLNFDYYSHWLADAGLNTEGAFTL